MRTLTSSYPNSTWPRQNIFLISTELVMTLLVCAVLAWLAQPLAVPGLDVGLGERYASAPAPASWMELWAFNPDLFSTLAQDPRAVLLLRTASYWLPAGGLIGLALLHIARTRRNWSSGLIVALWSAVAMAWRPFGLSMATGAAGVLAGLCAVFLSILRARVVGRNSFASHQEPGTLWNSMVWPGWVLLTGLGWLWIADFAARGPVATVRPGAKYFGLHQADVLFLANAIVLLAAAKSASIVQAFARLVNLLSSVWQRPRGPLVVLCLGGFIAILLGWLGHRVNPPLPFVHIAGGGMPHYSGELLRLIAGLSISWAAYRFGEWHASGDRLWRGLVGSGAVGVLCLFGLALSGDMGPILIMSLALILLLCAPVVKLVTRSEQAFPARRRQTVVLAVVGVAILISAGVWFWRTALTDWAPQFSHTAALREAARQDPFAASSPNLAQAHWLMDAAREVGGFGLGRVPYCGAKAHIEISDCTLGSGAPIQLPSDFAFAGLATTWGMAGAAACIALLFAWLRALVMAAMPPRLNTVPSKDDQQHQDNPLLWLRAWLVAVPCLIAQAQVLISVGGTLTWTPLTGVTLPLLGYGSAALCVMALWVGLTARPICGKPAV